MKKGNLKTFCLRWAFQGPLGPLVIWIDESSFPVILLFDFISQRRSPILAEKSRMDSKLSLFVLTETINHVTLLTSILARERCLKILGNVLGWLHIYQFYRIVCLFLFWFRWYQWYFCAINGCEDTNRNVCLYTSFSEGIALPCATSKLFKYRIYLP